MSTNKVRVPEIHYVSSASTKYEYPSPGVNWHSNVRLLVDILKVHLI